jgi:hypothetical protein
MRALAHPLALICCLAQLTAQKVGDEAPEIVWTATLGFGDIASGRLGDLRGSAVLLVVFSTRSATSKEAISHLNQLHATKAEEGLVVVGLTAEDAGAVAAFVTKHGVKHPVGVGFNEDYRIDGLPDSFLIDKDGKILWRGHPQAVDPRALESALAGAKPAVAVAGLEDVQSLRRSKDHGGAYRKAMSLLAGGTLSDRAKAQATDWTESAVRFVAQSIADADAAEQEKDWFLLWSKLEPVASMYQGVPGADAAKTRLAAMMADPKTKREIEAGRKVAEAKQREQALDFDGAHALYKEAAAAFGGTRAGKAASAAWAAIEKEGKLGFDATCGYCKAAGVACPAHTKAKKKRK